MIPIEQSGGDDVDQQIKASLIGQLQNGKRAQKFAAINHLGGAKVEEAVEPIIRAVSSADCDELSQAARVALEEIDTERAVEFVENQKRVARKAEPATEIAVAIPPSFEQCRQDIETIISFP